MFKQKYKCIYYFILSFLRFFKNVFRMKEFKYYRNIKYFRIAYLTCNFNVFSTFCYKNPKMIIFVWCTGGVREILFWVLLFLNYISETIVLESQLLK